MSFRKGARVRWNRAGSTATGKIAEVFTGDVEVLKSRSEIERAD